MICPKCGTKNEGNYCIKCGTIVKDNEVYQINTKQISKDVLLESYFGIDYNYIVMKPYNLFGAFLGPFYLIYRKCIISGTVLLLLQLGIFYLILPIIGALSQIFGNPILALLLVLVINFFFQGAITNPLIILHANHKINIIRKKYGPNKEKISKAGQPDFFAVLIFALLLILITMFIFYFKNTM